MSNEQPTKDKSANEVSSTTPLALVIFAWAWVGLPLAWGVLQTFNKTLELFK